LLVDFSKNGTLLIALTETAALIVKVCSVSRESYTGLIPMKPSDSIESLSFREYEYSLNSQDWFVPSDGRFRDWRRVIPQSELVSGEDADFNAKDYARMSRAAKLLGASKTGSLLIYSNGDSPAPVHISETAFGVLMPIRLRTPNERYRAPKWLGI
jgi:hypothetical protein